MLSAALTSKVLRLKIRVDCASEGCHSCTALNWMSKGFAPQPAASAEQYLGLTAELVLISLQKLRLLFEPFQAAKHARHQHMPSSVCWLS